MSHENPRSNISENGSIPPHLTYYVCGTPSFALVYSYLVWFGKSPVGKQFQSKTNQRVRYGSETS
jgi:hypothetical protein